MAKLAAAAAIALGALGVLGEAQAQGAKPIVVGSTLALTGPLSATGLVHKLVGEIYVDDLNRRGGLLGRKVEWKLMDDQSKPDLARTLYEQLLTADKVDLLMGPYATGAILSAIGVAQRYNKLLISHTMGIPSLAKYDMHFPAWSLGPNPQATVPTTVFDAVAQAPKPPKTVAIVTSKFPSVHFLSLGAREVFKQKGLTEVLFLEWEFGNRDFGPIAARVKDAKPDMVWSGDIGLEGNMLLEAMKKIDYVPPLHVHTYPAPGPMAAAPETDKALSLTIFEEHAPFTANPVAAQFVKTFKERATAAGLPYTAVETQAAASFTAWRIFEASVVATKSLDDRKMADWLKTAQVPTIQGTLRFDRGNNFGDDLMRIKQVQNKAWVTVWPKQWAAPGATIKMP
ncbi:MAG: ABC transporter substrate-binding protein [Alphaproteobacteria bacterium]|nr:ABC transporter substrate-binding protein [Alphaproteobacteria bacterium]